MIRRPPRATRTDTLFPYTTLVRSIVSQMLSRPLSLQCHVAKRLRRPRHIRIDRVDRAAKTMELKRIIVGGTDALPRAVDDGGSELPQIGTPMMRSEARRVGKECVKTCRYRWAPCHEKKKKQKKK